MKNKTRKHLPEKNSTKPPRKPAAASNSVKELEGQLQELRAKLDEAQEVIRAVHSGEVDAVLVATPEGERAFTLEGAEHPYRVFVENIGEGAVTLSPDGTILYCNARFAMLTQQPHEKITGTTFLKYIPAEHHELVTMFLRQSEVKECRGETELQTSEGSVIPVQLSISNIHLKGSELRCVLVTNLTEQKHNAEITFRELVARSLLDQHKKSEKLLRESEERFRAVLDSSRDIIYRLNVQNRALRVYQPRVQRGRGVFC